MQPFGMSDQDHVEIWRRYRLGETQDTIGAAIGCTGPAVYYAVRQRGGIAPPARQRAVWVLSLAEREQISRGLAGGASVRGIAQTIGRAPSTVSREIRRAAGVSGHPRGSARLAPRTTAETLSLSDPPRTACDRRHVSGGAVVSATDRGVVTADLPR